MKHSDAGLTLRGFASFYLPGYATVIIYMLQNTEYQPASYLKWYWRTTNFSEVMKRRTLERTKAARLLLAVLRVGMIMQILAGLTFIYIWVMRDTAGMWQLGLSLLIAYPIVWAHLIVIPLALGRIFIVMPRERMLIRQSKQIFAKHKGIKIAVAGSYGKTSMKELLGTVLSEGKNVAITPANKNVASSHAAFAAGLKGDEDVLVIEYGEGAPGDVRRFAQVTRPDIGVITGLAPAHLDKYPTLKAAGEDIFSLAKYLHNKNVYVNDESQAAKSFIKSSHITYDSHAVGDWKISHVQVDIQGTSFTLATGKKTFHLKSGLIGRHQIGPLAVTAVIADQLGLTKQHIEQGIQNTKSFEHRLEPRHIGGAWLLDDTYNGNIDGIKAGLALLKELPAKRKIYVTPGLVDQGVETERVHREMGELIAAAKPDKVVLMENSVTQFIKAGLKASDYEGELEIEDEPLAFYTGLEHLVAAGDLWLLQNDWTDNYA
jgi:UDP-N-acetylmuramoyl-tripeptide--D-alanyl-D-alanine ligase